jgi:hypothetical protein
LLGKQAMQTRVALCGWLLVAGCGGVGSAGATPSPGSVDAVEMGEPAAAPTAAPTVGGLLWDVEIFGGGGRLRGVWGSSATDVYAVGDGGIVVRSSGDGRWTTLPSGCSDDLHAVWGAGPDEIYVVGAVAMPSWSGSVLRSTDRGASWRLTRNAGTLHASIWGTGGDDVYVADYHALYHSVDHGVSWNAITLATLEVDAVWGVARDDLFAVGNSNANQQTIVHSRDAFASVTAAQPGNPDGLLAVWGSGAADVWAVGAPASVYRSGDDGASWDDVTPPEDVGGVVGVWGSAADDVYVVTVRGLLLHTADGGRSWTSVTLPSRDGFAAIWGATAKDIYLVGGAGQILHGHE